MSASDACEPVQFVAEAGARVPQSMVEGVRLEFKMHTAVAIEDIATQQQRVNTQHKLKRTKQPISKTMNAFLNSGLGGSILIGVTDDGVVRGLPFTASQLDHFMLAVSATLARYTPTVSQGVHVTYSRVGGQQQQRATAGQDSAAVGWAQRSVPHRLFTACHCWCGATTLQTLHNRAQPGSSLYLVHIRVLPPARDERGFGRVWQNEEGLAYIRRTTSNHLYTIQMLYEQSQQDVANEAKAASYNTPTRND